MEITLCLVTDCTKLPVKRKMCENHYRRFMKYGNAEAPRLRIKREPGYRETMTNGYIRVYGNHGHPKADKAGRVFEHTLVLESVIGRYLLPGENVHHKNGVRADNRPENLELWVVNQPYGQRPEDLVKWAKEILERYDNND